MCISDPLAGYFPNENKECMKFKIGDIVRVNIDDNARPSNSKPLEDYNGKLFTIGGFDGKTFSMADDLHIDKCEFLEKCLIPFDGFRVGDTVWTAKRGKGKICGSAQPFECASDTPFLVKFESCEKFKYPKLSNLIPTEAKYKEAMTCGFSVDVCYVTSFNPKIEKYSDPSWVNPYFGKIQIAGCNEIKVDDAVLYRGKKWIVEEIHTKTQQFEVHPPILLSEDYVLRRSDHMGGYKAVVSREDISLWKEPKFRVGDEVFYINFLSDNKKWVVIDALGNGNVKLRQINTRGNPHECTRPESQLRLWKETKITHVDNCDPISSYGNINNDKSAMSKLKYIGKHLNGKDMFLQDAGNGKSVLWYGEKGDDC